MVVSSLIARWRDYVVGEPYLMFFFHAAKYPSQVADSSDSILALVAH